MRTAMKIRSPKDFWSGLIFVAMGVAFVALASQYRMGDLHRMGPGLFPTMVGGLLAALGAIVAARSLVSSARWSAGCRAPDRWQRLRCCCRSPSVLARRRP